MLHFSCVGLTLWNPKSSLRVFPTAPSPWTWCLTLCWRAIRDTLELRLVSTQKEPGTMFLTASCSHPKQAPTGHPCSSNYTTGKSQQSVAACKAFPDIRLTGMSSVGPRATRPASRWSSITSGCSSSSTGCSSCRSSCGCSPITRRTAQSVSSRTRAPAWPTRAPPGPSCRRLWRAEWLPRGPRCWSVRTAAWRWRSTSRVREAGLLFLHFQG